MATFETRTEPVFPLTREEIRKIDLRMDEICSDQERLFNLSERIAGVVNAAWSAGHFILNKTPEDIARKIEDRMAAVIPATDEDGNDTFHYYRGMTKLVVPKWYEDYPVVEGGTLIANPHRAKLKDWKRYRSSHAVMIANSLPSLTKKELIINTSRSLASKRAGLGAGAVIVSRSQLLMIDALTCDDSCLPGSDGRPAGVIFGKTDYGQDCVKCPVNEACGGSEIIDGCYLLTPHPERALEFESRLQQEFDGDVMLARRVLVEGGVL